MNYTLLLGLQQKKYKKSAKITVHLGERMVDVFSIDKAHKEPDDIMSLFSVEKDLELLWYDKTHCPMDDTNCLNRLPERGPWTRSWSMTPVPDIFKVYHIADRELDAPIFIKVENNDNNYTNGFMTQTSLVRIPMIALFPTKFTMNHAEYLMQAILRINNSYDQMIARTGIGHQPNDDTRPGWPCANSFHVKRDSEKYNKSGMFKFDSWIGGNFTAEILVAKKFGIKYLTARGNRTMGFPYTCSAKDMFVASFKQLLNIYNEDKRSNHTED